MKKVLIGLLALGSLTLHAQVDCGTTINKLQVFRVTNKMKILESELGKNGYALTDKEDAEINLDISSGVQLSDGSFRSQAPMLGYKTIASVSLINHPEVSVSAMTRTKYHKSASHIQRKIRKLQSKKIESISESNKNKDEIQRLEKLRSKIVNDAEADEYLSVIKKLPLCSSLKN